MDDTDQNLLKRAVAGDRAALTELLEQHAPVIRRRLVGRIPSRFQAVLSEDDVLQQTYTDAFLGIGNFVPKESGSLMAWLCTLAKRNLVDAVRMLDAEKRGGSHKRRENRSPDDSCQALFEILMSTITTPSRQVARSEAAHVIRQVIQQLPETHRQVVQLYDLEGRSLQEVATLLGRSPGAVSMLRMRAHARLAGMMGTASQYFSA